MVVFTGIVVIRIDDEQIHYSIGSNRSVFSLEQTLDDFCSKHVTRYQILLILGLIVRGN